MIYKGSLRILNRTILLIFFFFWLTVNTMMAQVKNNGTELFAELKVQLGHANEISQIFLFPNKKKDFECKSW